eukprot:scaffold77281_cov56-Attheya_sp.AAC.1
MGCWISNSFSGREYKLIRARSVGRLLYRSLRHYVRDRDSSRWTHVTWVGLSLYGELGEERESTEQEACGASTTRTMAVSTRIDVTGCCDEVRTMAAAETTTHTMSAC